MRRGFNKKLLPTKAPEKYTKLKKRKANNRKSLVIRDILMQLKKQAGDQYSVEDFAKACYVKESSIKLWFYGRPYGKITISSIARYFSPLVGRPQSWIRKELEEARLKAWSNQ